MNDQLRKFDQSLLINATWSNVSLQQIFYDDLLNELFAKANPKSGLRSNGVYHNPYLHGLLTLQSPIIAYQYRNNFRALAGAFTLDELHKAAAQNLINADLPINIFILSKKPTPCIRRRIILFDLTNNLLSKCFINDTKKISHFLRAWFTHDEGKRSIFQSKEWLSIYPELCTFEKLAQYLCISKKDL